MNKAKIPRKSTFQDMTAMCDVAFLLLTFFMLTSNFTKKEAIIVSTPSSISEIKIPETNIMTILINPEGKLFFGIDKQEDRRYLLEQVSSFYGMQFTEEEIQKFSLVPSFGVPLNDLKRYLALSPEKRDYQENLIGIPVDTTALKSNEIRSWVMFARQVNKDYVLAIKSDQNTPYTVIKNVIKTLKGIKENRFNLITALEEPPIIK